MSSSSPNTGPIETNDTPRFSRFCLQSVKLVQELSESPPKLNPTNGTMYPSARTRTDVTAISASATTTKRNKRTGVLLRTIIGAGTIEVQMIRRLKTLITAVTGFTVIAIG